MGVPQLTPEVMGKARTGDIRHCFADISLARDVLGFQPRRSFDDSLGELAEWVRQQQARGPGARRAARARAARPGGMTRGGEPPFWSPAARASSAATWRTGWPGWARTVIVFDALARPGVERNLDWLRRRHGSRISPVVADIRDRGQLDRAVDRGRGGVPHGRPGGGHDQPGRPGGRFRRQSARHAARAGGGAAAGRAARRWSSPAPTRSTATWPTSRWSATARPICRRTPRLRARGIGEDRPLDFYTPYGCSKGAADQYVLDYARCYGVPACVLRMSCIYGPRQLGTEDQGWLAHFLYSVRAGRPISIYGDGRQVRDVLYVDDAVDAYVARLAAASAQVSGQAFNLGGGPANAVTLLQVLAEIGEITGRAPDLRFADWRPGDQRYFVADTSPGRAAPWACGAGGGLAGRAAPPGRLDRRPSGSVLETGRA